MSFDVNWNVEKYREDHESDEHWELRRAFILRWKDNFPEERLICLARVFANIEFMGCRYPSEVMQEVAKLSKEVANEYRMKKKTKLQRTFVSASDAAEDRARGIKREGGIVKDVPQQKSTKIEFVKQCTDNSIQDFESRKGTESDENATEDDHNETANKLALRKERIETGIEEYLQEMSQIQCISVNKFRESMFQTEYGRLVLLVRPWSPKLWNIQASCQACGVPIETTIDRNTCRVTVNGRLLVSVTGDTKQDAKNNAGNDAWNRLKGQIITVLIKDKFIAQDGATVCPGEMSGRSDDVFGTPVDAGVATKMMKLMGWKGGGLGAESQGIAEPIKPNLQMVNRAGLGSSTSDIRKLRESAHALMSRYLNSDTLDVDLVFSSEFGKEERAALHQVAKKFGLWSRSYGHQDYDRFLVVKKKIDPFSIVRQVIKKGGLTPKYQVFIPEILSKIR